MKFKLHIISSVILIVITLFLVESMLRLQQHFGPIYDLALENITLEGLSNSLNHKPLLTNKQKLAGKKTYGSYDGFEYIAKYDRNGIRINSNRPNSNVEQSDEKSILFLGDSFMQGYDDDNTIPQIVYEILKKHGTNVSVINAGVSSYSPSIFIPQAKFLIPKLKPDFVVVDIDETDLGDDFIRYKELISRDDNGNNIGVRQNPIGYELNNGLLNIKEHYLYITRLVLKIYHTKFHMPNFINRYRKDKRHVLSFSWDKDPNIATKYKNEINFFKENLNELSYTLIKLMGSNQKIIYLYHPHLQHIHADKDGFFWNNTVANTIHEVAQKHNIKFFNATDNLKEAFDDRPFEFYWKGDMHFNFKGLRKYSEYVADILINMFKVSKTTNPYSS